MIQIALSRENKSLVVHNRVAQCPINVEIIGQWLVKSSLQYIIRIESLNRQALLTMFYQTKVLL